MAENSSSRTVSRGRRASASSFDSISGRAQIRHGDESSDDGLPDGYSSQDLSPLQGPTSLAYDNSFTPLTPRDRDRKKRLQNLFRSPATPRVRDIEAQTGQSIALQDINRRSQSQIKHASKRDNEPVALLHDWEQEHLGTHTCIRLKENHLDESAQQNVIWLHVEDDAPNLDTLKEHFESSLESRVPPSANSVLTSTKRLIERVRLTRERHFPGGKFLKPGALRQDCTLSGSDRPDDPCMFLVFPFLTVGQSPSNTIQNGIMNSNGRNIERSHSVRTLLQYRFKSKSIKKMDENQAITSLSYENVRQCIRSYDNKQLPPRKGRWTQKIYVPQLWVLSIAGDMMITMSSISKEDLLGQSLMVSMQAGPRRPNVVEFRVQLDNGRTETFLYPYCGCESYIGLKNKKLRILSLLGLRHRQGHDNKSKQQAYKMYWKHKTTKKKTLITVDNWIKILRRCASRPEDRVAVLLQRERQALPQLQLNLMHQEDTKTLSKASEKSNISHSRTGLPRLVIPTSNRLAPGRLLSGVGSSLNHQRSPSQGSAGSPSGKNRIQPDSFEAFFLWPFEEDTKGPSERVEAWLRGTAIKLTSKYASRIDEKLIEAFVSLSDDLESDVPSDYPRISGYTREDVRVKFFPDSPIGVSTAPASLPDGTSADHGLATSQQSQEPAIDTSSSQTLEQIEDKALGTQRRIEARRFYHRARRLLALFVPEYDPSKKPRELLEHEIVLLYWGLIDRILDNTNSHNFEVEHLMNLSEELNRIIDYADKIHTGVQSYRYSVDDGKHDLYAVNQMPYAKILDPIPTAFEHIMDLLFEVTVFINNGSDKRSPILPFEDSVREDSEKACEKLKTARQLLTARAGDSILEKRLGPIVTTEAMTLLFIERISQGVFGNSSIDITDIYDRIVTRLTSKVEDRASRHLLLDINQVSVELDIILDVYNQQKRFLDSYRDCLDPKDAPMITRHMRFPYEKKIIARIIEAVKERINDCDDLKLRIEQLADQNVRLVESYQDDNNRTILLFTTVTIIFLPLTFFTGFFGMNVHGIVDTQYSVRHFWITAMPVTVGVLLVSLSVTYWRETLRNLRHLARIITE